MSVRTARVQIDRKKVAKLAEVVDGMRSLHLLASTLRTDCPAPASRLLAPLFTLEANAQGEGGGGLFPDIAPLLSYFDTKVGLPGYTVGLGLRVREIFFVLGEGEGRGRGASRCSAFGTLGAPICLIAIYFALRLLVSTGLHRSPPFYVMVSPRWI